MDGRPGDALAIPDGTAAGADPPTAAACAQVSSQRVAVRERAARCLALEREIAAARTGLIVGGASAPPAPHTSLPHKN